MRSIPTALVAAFASLLIPVSSLLYLFLQGPDLDPSGRPDNAPYRAAAFGLMLSPVLLAFVAAYFLFSTWLLRRLGRLSASGLLALAAAPAAAVGAHFALQDPQIGGPRDAALSFVLFGGLTFVSLALGSLAWWWAKPAA